MELFKVAAEVENQITDQEQAGESMDRQRDLLRLLLAELITGGY